MNATKNKTGRKDLKLKRDPPQRGSLCEMLQQGAGSSGEPLRDPGAASEPAVEFSSKGSDATVVHNIPEAKPKTLLGVSSTDIPLQGASTSSIPAAGERLGHLVSGVGGQHLAKKALSGCTRGS